MDACDAPFLVYRLFYGDYDCWSRAWVYMPLFSTGLLIHTDYSDLCYRPRGSYKLYATIMGTIAKPMPSSATRNPEPLTKALNT